MCKVFKSDIVAIILDDGQLISSECLTPEQWDNIKYSDIVTAEDIANDENHIYFCNESGRRLP